MKILQNTLQRDFTVKHKGKCYYVNYLNSDGQILRLINRGYWEISDEDGEEVNVYMFKSIKYTKKENQQIKNNRALVEKLIKFCIKHFNDYNPV